MGERVNIQYSVDMDDLGGEICRLIHDAFENLNTVNESATAPTNNIMSLQTIKKIDEIRDELSDIDRRLSDSINIINGYISYKSQLIARQEISDAADQEHQENLERASGHQDNNASDALLDLQDKIREFQNEQPDSQT